MTDTLTEIWLSIRNHKMRVAITGASIVWAVFLLIFLMGAGGGVVAGVADMVGLDTLCIFTVQPGLTQKPWMGYDANRNIELTTRDLGLLKEQLGSRARSIEAISEGPMDEVTFGQYHTQGRLMGVTSDYLSTQKYYISRGSNLSALDMQHRQKVCILPEFIYRILMPNLPDPQGLEIQICGEVFTVVGIYKSDLVPFLPPYVLIPITTASDLWNQRNLLSTLLIINEEPMTDDDEIASYTHEITGLLSQEHQFDPTDVSAMQCHCTSQQSLQIQKSLGYIRLFIWFICISALLVGVTGISNIMLISIKDRTKEFGVRKVMGASDQSLLNLVLGESVTITLLFGYLGVVLGLVMLWLTDKMLLYWAESDMFSQVSIGMDVILWVVGILVMTGVLAGLLPAIQAFRMKPIEAMSS